MSKKTAISKLFTHDSKLENGSLSQLAEDGASNPPQSRFESSVSYLEASTLARPSCGSRRIRFESGMVRLLSKMRP